MQISRPLAMFSHPEVLTILRAHYASLNDDTKVEIKMPGTRAKLRVVLLFEVEPIELSTTA